MNIISCAVCEVINDWPSQTAANSDKKALKWRKNRESSLVELNIYVNEAGWEQEYVGYYAEEM